MNQSKLISRKELINIVNLKTSDGLIKIQIKQSNMNSIKIIQLLNQYSFLFFRNPKVCFNANWIKNLKNYNNTIPSCFEDAVEVINAHHYFNCHKSIYDNLIEENSNFQLSDIDFLVDYFKLSNSKTKLPYELSFYEIICFNFINSILKKNKLIIFDNIYQKMDEFQIESFEARIKRFKSHIGMILLTH